MAVESRSGAPTANLSQYLLFDRFQDLAARQQHVRAINAIWRYYSADKTTEETVKK